MIPAADTWGPFRPNLDPAERKARLRCLRAVAHLTTGPRVQDLVDLLAQAEREPAAIEPALRALNRLAALDRRHVLASYAALNRPAV